MTTLKVRKESEIIHEMFTKIAGRYDFTNHLLSFGIDYYWRWRLARMVKACKPKRVADLATGSGDVAFALKKALGQDVEVLGFDFCEGMLNKAIEKRERHVFGDEIQFAVGDCMNLPLEDASVDVLTIGFGLRNVEERRKGLEEMRRVLRPGGRLFILEFSQPMAWFKPIYYFYLKKLIPGIAWVATGHKCAYEYLIESVGEFPGHEQLSREIKAAGYRGVRVTRLMGGAVAIHECEA